MRLELVCGIVFGVAIGLMPGLLRTAAKFGFEVLERGMLWFIGTNFGSDVLPRM